MTPGCDDPYLIGNDLQCLGLDLELHILESPEVLAMRQRVVRDQLLGQGVLLQPTQAVVFFVVLVLVYVFVGLEAVTDAVEGSALDTEGGLVTVLGLDG